MNLRIIIQLGLYPLACGGIATAFPPAPYYTLYGIVRDQAGQTVMAEGARVILLKGEKELEQTLITTGSWLDQNYELQIRIDQSLGGSPTYSPMAVPAGGAFSLAVVMNGLRFYPIEVSGNLRTGTGGERRRLDLTLGPDSDEDGLPDIWEEWQLYQAGYLPDADGWDLRLIDKEGDLDGDGQSNWFEYLAGTFAGDATEQLSLEIMEKVQGRVRIEFYAITGKSYTIERSTDLLNWTRVSFATMRGANADIGYVATQSGVLSAHLNGEPDQRTFYRLNVQ